MPKPKEKPKIEEVTQKFGKAHAEEADAKSRMEKFKKQFYDLIEIPESELARQTIYYEGNDPEQHVATLYPKWRIVEKKVRSAHMNNEHEWKIIIQEDPEKKTYVFINPLDKKVYTRTVAESAPGVDIERLKQEAPRLWENITVQPPPPEREFKPITELTEDQKDELKRFFLPVKLTNRMEKPRPAKPEELEGIPTDKG